MRTLVMRALHRLGVRPHFGGPIKHVRLNNVRLQVSLESDVGCQLYCFRRFEPAETAIVKRLIEPNATCVDVGANVGYYTLLLASLVPAGQVHAFEPLSDCCELIAGSVELNGFRHVTINCAAVADVDGEAEFTISSDNAYSSLRYSSRFSVARISKVPVVTLDSYAREMRLKDIGFLKVDTEGAEMRVLEGASGLLSDPNRSPRTIMLELYDPLLAAYGTDVEQVVDHLRGYGYLPFVTVGRSLVPFESWHKNRYWNVFFFRDQRFPTMKI